VGPWGCLRVKDLLLTVATPEHLTWLGFMLLAGGLVGEVAILTEPLESHWSHKLIGFICAVFVAVGYVIGHLGDEAIATRFENRAVTAEEKLNKLTSDRVLADARAMVEELKSFGGQEYQMVTFWEMREPLATANLIHAALQTAGWKYIPLDRATMMLGGIEGVQVWVHPNADPQARRAAEQLVLELNKAHLSAVLREQNAQNPKDNKINLNVGTKPG
jgi:hypothetical protein